MKRILGVLVILLILSASCEVDNRQAVSSSGVKKATVKVKTQASGLTVEQENISMRLTLENKPGSIKHLYVISAMSGQVIIYSTVKGKVTSSGKRLTPLTLNGGTGDMVGRSEAMLVDIAGSKYYTKEVIQDDGTYGSSIPYLFWWDAKGKYHQHYVSGGQILHVSDHIIPVKNITLRLD